MGKSVSLEDSSFMSSFLETWWHSSFRRDGDHQSWTASNTFISQLRGPSFHGRRFASRDHSSINRLLGRASSRHLLRFEMGDKLADGALWRERFFLFFFVLLFGTSLPWLEGLLSRIFIHLVLLFRSVKHIREMLWETRFI